MWNPTSRPASAGAPETLDPLFRLDFTAGFDDRTWLRVVVDQIALLTDGSALAWHQRMCSAA